LDRLSAMPLAALDINDAQPLVASPVIRSSNVKTRDFCRFGLMPRKTCLRSVSSGQSIPYSGLVTGTASDFFLDSCGLASTPAQVVQLGATNITATLDLDRIYDRAIGLENTLHTFSV